MRIEHVALWAVDLEAMKDFYVRHFGASASERYENRAKGFASYFLSLPDGARLELMRKDSIAEADGRDRVAALERGARSASDERSVNAERVERLGFAHLAFSCGSEAEVDRLAKAFAAEGVPVVSGPRRTGDGYYEVVIRDPEGNLLEITV
jgi:lactoylglutathione lyase